MKLTHEELAALPAKTKKNPDVVALYLENDFLTAYAKHTDMRVERDGPAAAVGAVKDWERHGELQCQFLLEQGLKPDHMFLEIGCGTGRLARKIVPYLLYGHYYGIDISDGALSAADRLAVSEGWDSRAPIFSTAFPSDRSIDFAWAFSVFIHLPADIMQATMCEVARRLRPGGQFFFSYVPEKADVRTGLKQFRHTEYTYTQAAFKAGLSFDECEDWRGEQRIAMARRIK